jgi:CRP/FNR family transcriptional regulator
MQKKLDQSILFSGVDPATLDAIENAGRRQIAEKGTFLFFQGDPADRFYVVLSGKVKVSKTSPDGKEQILLMASPGDSFGEAALFAKTTYPASAEVMAEAELVSFSYDNFMSLITDNPAVAVNMIGRLSMLLHHLTKLIQQLSLEDVSTRLAGYILGLMTSETPANEETVTLTEKKMVLASMLGTIPETLSRAFAALTKAGIIAIKGQEVSILDYTRLVDIANGEKIRPA